MNTKQLVEMIRSQAARLQEKSYLIPENLRQWWLHYLEGHLPHYISVISRLPSPESCGPLLEVGSIPGHLTLMMAELGYKISGVDIDPERMSELWKAYHIHINKVNIETEPLPFDDQSFSVVLFTEVFEHLRVQPIFALREVFRVSKIGGQIIFSVPNITPKHRLKFLFGRDYQGDIIKEFEKLEKFGHMGHIRLYSINEIKKILKHVGYTDIKYAYEGSPKAKRLWRLVTPFSKRFRGRVYFTAKRMS